VVELLAILSGTGLTDYVTRETARHPESAKALWRQLTTLRFAYVCVVVPIGIGVLALLKYPRAVLFCLFCLAISLLPRAFSEVSLGILRAANRLTIFLSTELVQGVALLGVATIMILRGHGLLAVVVSEAVAAMGGAIVVAVAVITFVARRNKSLPPGFHLIRTTYVFNIIPLIVNTYDRLDVVLLSKLAGNVAAGIYSLPYRAFGLLQILPYGIMGVLLPRLATARSASGDRSDCRKVMSILFGAALLAILAVMLLADVVTQTVLGPRYEGSAVAMKILIWATIPMYLNYGFNTFLLARNRERVLLRTASVCLAFNVIANLLLIPRYSFRAAAATTILTELVLLAQNVFLVRETLGFLPHPAKMLRIFTVFVAVLSMSLLAAHFVDVLPASLLGLSVFSIYLYSYCVRYVGRPSAQVVTVSANG